MSIENIFDIKQHDIARAEIESWRGDCLDLFAQGDATIGALLEFALGKGFEVQLFPHSAQRTMEAARLVDLVGGNEAEIADAGEALDAWQALESRGELLAHGTVTEVLDRHGKWHAIIDTVTYRAGKPNKGRWAVSQAEADEFNRKLAGAFTRLRAQLGCLRLRVDS